MKTKTIHDKTISGGSSRNFEIILTPEENESLNAFRKSLDQYPETYDAADLLEKYLDRAKTVEVNNDNKVEKLKIIIYENEAEQFIQKFLTMMEKLGEFSIKKLHCDNDSEVDTSDIDSL